MAHHPTLLNGPQHSAPCIATHEALLRDLQGQESLQDGCTNESEQSGDGGAGKTSQDIYLSDAAIKCKETTILTGLKAPETSESNLPLLHPVS